MSMYKKFFFDFFFSCYIVKYDRKLEAYACYKVFPSWEDSTPTHRSNNEQISPSKVSSAKKESFSTRYFFPPYKSLRPTAIPLLLPKMEH